MYNKLSLANIYNQGSPLDAIGSNYQLPSDAYTWEDFQRNNQPSVADVLAKRKESNLSPIGSSKSSSSKVAVPANNPSIGYLGDTGNWVSGITGALNSFLSINNEKNAQDKQLLGQIIQGLGGGMAMSDKRLKENIKAVGKLDNGLTVYLFNFKGQDVPQIGLIAQEVREFFPEIVNEDADGYLSLDYAKLTVIILRVLKDLIDKK